MILGETPADWFALQDRHPGLWVLDPERAYTVPLVAQALIYAGQFASVLGGAFAVGDITNSGRDVQVAYTLDRTFPTAPATTITPAWIAVIYALAPFLTEVFMSAQRAAELQAAAPLGPVPLKITTGQNLEGFARLRFKAPPTPPQQPQPQPPPGPNVGNDLSRNWGSTPASLRPLFIKIEAATRIKGAGRFLAIVAKRESAFKLNAQNGDRPQEQGERDASRRAYDAGRNRNPPLRYGQEAANFGSGGLFGLLAPYFLWTGVNELGANAPFLDSRPELVFNPNASAFGAAVYLQRILKNYTTNDLPDIKAGWASPTLLTSARGSPRYHETRARFLADAKALGIRLDDPATLPAKLSAANWPGASVVFNALVGTVPGPPVTTILTPRPAGARPVTRPAT